MKLREIAALVALTAAIGWMLNAIPSWQRAVADPCIVATVSTAVFTAWLWLKFLSRSRAIRTELWLLAVFLIAMPCVYVAKYFSIGNAISAPLWLEVAGIAIFATLAVLGLKRSPWFLAAGILAHGVAWDAWHFHAAERAAWRASAFIPDWYAMGCLLVDVALAAYVAVRVPAYRTAARAAA